MSQEHSNHHPTADPQKLTDLFDAQVFHRQCTTLKALVGIGAAIVLLGLVFGGVSGSIFMVVLGLCLGGCVLYAATTLLEREGHSPQIPAKHGVNGMAVASLVCGVVWVFWLGSALALATGYKAQQEIRMNGQDGNGLAVAGIVLGWIGTGTYLLALVGAFGAALTL